MTVELIDRSSKVGKVCTQMVRDIQSGKFQPGILLPSENKLAENYNVSRPTIRKVIEILTKKKTLEKLPYRGVQPAFSQGTPNSVERQVEQVVFASPALNMEAEPYIHGINSALDIDKYVLTTFVTNSYIHGLSQAYLRILQLVPCGIILDTSGFENFHHIPAEDFNKSGIPIVLLGQHEVPGLNCDRVVISPQLNMQTLCQNTLSENYRKVVFFGSTPLSTSKEAVLTLRHELSLLGLSLPDENIVLYDAPKGYDPEHPDSYIDAKEKMSTLLADGFKCDLLVCGHDYPAEGALLALQEAGLAAPGYMGVCSMMRNVDYSPSGRKLTSINLNNKAMGAIAGQLLQRRIDGYKGAPEVHYVQPEFIAGDTTSI